PPASSVTPSRPHTPAPPRRAEPRRRRSAPVESGPRATADRLATAPGSGRGPTERATPTETEVQRSERARTVIGSSGAERVSQFPFRRRGKQKRETPNFSRAFL